jgi:hypothetical protein
MSTKKRNEDLKSRIELLEKELLHLKGRRRDEARTEYLRLLKSCGKEFGLEEPIYLMRC